MRKLLKTLGPSLIVSLALSLGAWALAIAIAENLPPPTPPSEVPQITGEENTRNSNPLIGKNPDQKNKGDAERHFQSGVERLQSGDLDGSIVEFRAAVRLNPSLAKAHMSLGTQLLRKGDVDGAILEYRTAISLDPKNERDHLGLGYMLLNEKQDIDGAIEEFRTAVRLNPNLADGHFGLGNALDRKGDLDGAIEEFRTAIRLNPNLADGHIRLGNALDKKGDLHGAIAEFRIAVRMNPSLEEGHIKLEDALGRMGNREGGSEEFRTADPSELLQVYKRSNYVVAEMLLEGQISAVEKKVSGNAQIASELYSDYLFLAYIQTWKLGDFDKGLRTYQKAALTRTSVNELREFPPLESFFIARILERKGDLPGARAQYLSLLKDLTEMTDYDKIDGLNLMKDEMMNYVKFEADGLSLQERPKDYIPLLPEIKLSALTTRLALTRLLFPLFLPPSAMESTNPGMQDATNHIKQTSANLENMFLEFLWIINFSAGPVTPSFEEAMRAYLLKYPDQYWSFLLGGVFYRFYLQNGQNEKAERLLNNLRETAKKRGVTLVIAPENAIHSPTPALPVGPYTGVVIDRLSGKAVEGAAVLFYWTRRVPQLIEGGSYTSETVKVWLDYTDKQGRYEIPEVTSNFGLSGSLESTTAVIYQPGYQAYIVTIWHDDPYRNNESPFREKNNRVSLERVPPRFHHREHVGKIERALEGIYDYLDSASKDDITSERMLENQLEGSLEKREFLRRLEWEKRRSLEEK